MNNRIMKILAEKQDECPKIMKLAVPIMIETVLFMMLGFVDVYMLSRYSDLAASGVNTANQVIVVLSMVFLVFSTAGSIQITQYLGAEQKENASRAAALALTLQMISGLVISLLVFLFSGPMIHFIGAKEEVYDFANQYLTLVGGFLFLQALNNALASIIRCHGLAKPPMLVAVGVNLLNIVLDILLVPAMGVIGAGLATVIGRAAGVIALTVILFRKVEKPSIFRLLRPWPRAELKQVFRLGIPSAAETFLYQLSQLIITSLVLWNLTENELITKTYMSNIATLFLLFSCSVGQAAQIVIGYLVGKGDFDEAKRQGYRAYRLALIVSVCVVGICIILRRPIMSCFTENPEVIRLAGILFIIELFLEAGRAGNLTVIPCLRGAGDVKFPTMWAIFSNMVIGLGGAQLLGVTLHMGIQGLWIAMAADEVFRSIVMLIRWHGPKWRNKQITAAKENAAENAG